MKNISLVFNFILTITLSWAQHIPDPNFATAIRKECPACIDANNNLTMNARSLTELNVSTGDYNCTSCIYDLTGQYRAQQRIVL